MNKDILNRFRLGWETHGPGILVKGGIIGNFAALLLTGWASTKLPSVIAEHKENVAALKDEHKDEPVPRKELVKEYIKTGGKLVKLYAPAAGTYVLSSVSILGGHNMLNNQHASLAAAYMTLDSCYKNYRKRVAERYGDDVDYELRNDIHSYPYTDEDGNECTVKAFGDDGPAVISRRFAYGESKYAEPSDSYNRAFLENRQTLLNTRLKANHFMFLNDVLDDLGFDRVAEGQTLGWIYDEKSPTGDNYITFNTREIQVADRNSPTGFSTVFLLNFNIDGNIITHAKKRGLLK